MEERLRATLVVLTSIISELALRFELMKNTNRSIGNRERYIYKYINCTYYVRAIVVYAIMTTDNAASEPDWFCLHGFAAYSDLNQPSCNYVVRTMVSRATREWNARARTELSRGNYKQYDIYIYVRPGRSG